MNLVKTLTVLGCFAVLSAPVLADEPAVPQDTLAALGLSELEPMTAAEGQNVRGAAFVKTMGTSVVTGFLFDPNTKSFVIGGEADGTMAVADGKGKHGITAYTVQGSSLALQLNVALDGMPVFNGWFIGSAGGSAIATAH